MIADWHYVDTEPSGYGNLGVFRNDGFSTIASTWNRPGNITNFAKARLRGEELGAIADDLGRGTPWIQIRSRTMCNSMRRTC